MGFLKQIFYVLIGDCANVRMRTLYFKDRSLLLKLPLPTLNDTLIFLYFMGTEVHNTQVLFSRVSLGGLNLVGYIFFQRDFSHSTRHHSLQNIHPLNFCKWGQQFRSYGLSETNFEWLF